MAKDTTLREVVLLPFQDISDYRGELYVIEGASHVPFEVKRVFWITSLPQDIVRGGHAHLGCHQFIVALKGRLDVIVDDGREKRTVRLDRPTEGLYVPPGVWAREEAFSEDVLYLVLASGHYDEEDYLRDYQAFLRYKND